MKQITRIILKAFFALTLLGSLFSCSTFFHRKPAAVRTDRKHYIMTLHGVRGNENSYGQFHELIKAHLEKIDPGYTVVPLNLTFKTAQENFTTHQAARELTAKLDQAIPVLNAEDKISVVAYSMGAQVGVAWYYDSLADPTHRHYALQTENFISLAGAYWGAQESALFTNDIDTFKRTLKGIILELNRTTKELALNYHGRITESSIAAIQNLADKLTFSLIDRMNSIQQIKDFYDKRLIGLTGISFAELEALSIAAATETELRLAMMNNKTNTRWVSVSTLVQCFETDLGSETPGCNDYQFKLFSDINKLLGKYTFGYIRRETDNAVITPSSVAQFYYAVETDKNYLDGAFTPATSFRFSIDPQNHKVIFAETLHATVVTEGVYDKVSGYLGRLGESWSRLADDVVIVHKSKCLTPENCNHPVYKYLLAELANCDRANSSCDQDQYQDLVGHFQKSKADEQRIQDQLRSELHGFTVEFNLRLPIGYDVSKITESNIFDFIQMDFAKFDNDHRTLVTDKNWPYQIEIGRKMELGSILIKKLKYADQDQLKVHLTGLIIPNDKNNYDYKSLEKGTPIQFKVNLPKLKSRRIEALVRPYHSTYIDLMLAPK